MGRLAQGHFDDVFLNKVKQACIHVLDQLNDANEIEQAFDLCPSISRRNRVILSFLRDADHLGARGAVAAASSSSSISPSLTSRLLPGSVRSSREPSLGTDSVASLSAQRRRRAQEMQHVRDPNDSNDDSDSQATVGPSSSRRAHLDPASAHNPSMSQPDYTFEQFVEHLDPTDKLLKRSLEIIIKETARQALARKRDPNYDPTTASATSSHDPAATLRSAIASSQADRAAGSSRLRDETAFANRMSRVLNLDPASTSRNTNSSTADLDHAYQLLRSLRPASHSLTDHNNARSVSSVQANAIERRTLRDFLTSTTDRLSSTAQDSASRSSRFPRPSDSGPNPPARLLRPVPAQAVESSTISPDSLVPHLSQRRLNSRSLPSVGITPQTIAARLAEATRRNAEAARTINEAERLRSSQFIRTSIESLRASLFQLHMDLACTQLQHAQREEAQSRLTTSASAVQDIGASYALVMDTIELFDDTLRRLSCLVSNTTRDDASDPTTNHQETSAPRNADASQMRTSLWRARNLLLLSSMRRGTEQQDSTQVSATSSAAVHRDAELRAHRHLLATIEESHWSKPDAEPPSSDSIRVWRRKLAAWYYLDRDPARYPDAPATRGDREETYARWHPDLELPYALDDEIMAPMTSARPDPIADPRAAWAYARTHDASIGGDLSQDEQVREALASGSVSLALQQLLRAQTASREAAETAGGTTREPSTQAAIDAVGSADNAHGRPASEAIGDADPDVSLTRTTSLSRRNAVRSLPLTNSDASSIRSARSSLSLRRARGSFGQASTPMAAQPAVQDENDAIEEDIVETSMEIGTVPHTPEPITTGPFARPREDIPSESSLLPPPDRPRAARSGSFTFITTPAAVLRSTRRSASRSRADPRSQSPAAPADDEAAHDSDAEYIDLDLDLDLGMAGEDAFDFDLVDFLRSESRRHARRSSNAEDEVESVDASPPSLRRRRGLDEGDDASTSDIRVFVSGSGASTPAEARQATFEAYAQRARVLERRRRLERQRQDMEEDGVEAAVGGGNASQEASPEDRRRRRGRNVGGNTETEDDSDRRNSLPFPRTSER